MTQSSPTEPAISNPWLGRRGAVALLFAALIALIFALGVSAVTEKNLIAPRARSYALEHGWTYLRVEASPDAETRVRCVFLKPDGSETSQSFHDTASFFEYLWASFALDFEYTFSSALLVVVLLRTLNARRGTASPRRSI